MIAPISSRGDEGLAVAVQTDGKLVLGGVARDINDRYGLARVLP